VFGVRGRDKEVFVHVRIESATLNELLRRLTGRDRETVEQLLRGKQSDEAGLILRWIKRRLKRRVRSKRKPR
jgi:hypothetical protein